MVTEKVTKSEVPGIVLTRLILNRSFYWSAIEKKIKKLLYKKRKIQSDPIGFCLKIVDDVKYRSKFHRGKKTVNNIKWFKYKQLKINYYQIEMCI